MAKDLAATLAAAQEEILDLAERERRNLTADEERRYLALGRLRRVADQLAAFEAEDEERDAQRQAQGVHPVMTRELRELHLRLAEAEEEARAAIERQDIEAAEKAMEKVRALRAQIKREEAKVEREHESAYLRMREMRMMAAEGAFAKAILDAGFNLRERPVVTVPLAQAFPAEETWRVRPPEGILPLGRDTRWLFPLLPSRNLEAETAIEDFRQVSRTVTGSVERDPGATTEKARLDVAIEHVVEKVRQLAVVVGDVPNAVLESITSAEAFFASEGRFVVEQTLDQHVLAQIQAANPPSSYTGDNLIERVRHAIAAMRAEGVNPDVLVLNAADAAALDLFRQPGTQDYLFQTREAGAASPLFGLRVVEHPANIPPMLLDTRQLGVLYLGTLRVAADPFTGFTKNLTNLRFEMNALMHVRNAKAAHLIQQAV